MSNERAAYKCEMIINFFLLRISGERFFENALYSSFLTEDADAEKEEIIYERIISRFIEKNILHWTASELLRGWVVTE